MEHSVTVHIAALDEGDYVATSEDVQGLVAQGRKVQETLQLAQDVARRLMEARSERSQELLLKPVESSFDYPLVISG